MFEAFLYKASKTFSCLWLKWNLFFVNIFQGREKSTVVEPTDAGKAWKSHNQKWLSSVERSLWGFGAKADTVGFLMLIACIVSKDGGSG